VTFGEFDAGLLSAFEHLVLEDDTSHRRKYGYQCQYDDAFLFRYDRDGVQHPDIQSTSIFRPTSAGSPPTV
jgi:hypothetical protein